MDAKLFAREYKRMCGRYNNDCAGCPAEYANCVSSASMDKIVNIVEEWSAKNPMITNLDHVAEGLGKIGYKVDPIVLGRTCPSYLSGHYIDGMKCEKHYDCVECRKWWDKEYKEGTNEN